MKKDLQSITDDDQLLLKARAKDLAKPLITDSGKEKVIEVLLFTLNGEKYCISMEFVKEVTLLRHLTSLPGTPEFILGIMNIRGKIVSITDLRVFFNLPRKGLSDYNKIIVLSDRDMEFAILADQVDGVSYQVLSDLAPPPDTIKGIGKEFLEGVFPGPLIMLNSKIILHHPRLLVQRKAPDLIKQ